MSQPTNPRDSRVQRMIRQCATWLRALLLENWGAKLLSILIALALWAGLISQDPTLTREKSFRNVAISVNGQETLRRNGFIVLDDLEEALDDVSISANVPQGQYYNVKASNYSVRIDLSKISKAGKQEVQILTTNSSTFGTVTEISPATVTLTVDEYVTRFRIPVTVETQGEPPEGYYATAPACDPPTVAVSGPRSLVDRIVSAKVVADQPSLPAREGPVRRALSFVLLDSNEQVISSKLLQVTSESVLLDSIIIDQQLYTQRTVELSALGLVTGVPAEGYEVKGVYLTPATLTIAGNASAIADVNVMYPDSVINVTGMSQSVSRSLRVRQPSSIKYASSDVVSVVVDIGPVIVQRTWTDVPITLYGAGSADGVMAGVNVSTAAVTVTGPKNWVESLKKYDLTIQCDLSSITGVGSYVLPLSCVIADSEGQEFTCDVQPATVVLSMTQVND